MFAPDLILAALDRVDSDGGVVEPATVLGKVDSGHWWPEFLPDGIHFLYYLRTADDGRRGIHVGRIDVAATLADALLIPTNSNVVSVPRPDAQDGTLLYVVDDRIVARNLDTGRLRVAADARSLDLAAGGATLYQSMMVSASSNILTYAETAIPSGNYLETAPRNGRSVRVWDAPEAQNWPRLSPDGDRLARQRVDRVRGNPDIWVDDLARGTRVRVSTAIEPDIQPVWSPDGRSLAYVSGNLPWRTDGDRVLSIAAADSSGVLRTIKCATDYCEPTDWSGDGHLLPVNVYGARTIEVWTVAVAGDAAAQVLIRETNGGRDARFSPDGSWIAYVTEESGQPEVSVRSLFGPPRRVAISADGGAQPVWRRDGKELLFVNRAGDLYGAPVDWADDGTPTFGLPARVNVPPIGFGHWGTQYNVSSDGGQIYFMRANDASPPRTIHVITDWQALLD